MTGALVHHLGISRIRLPLSDASWQAPCTLNGRVVKVLDLFCADDHAFEGWFGSEDDFQSQLARGLVQCPCGNAHIRKRLSAPRLNLRSSSDAGPQASQPTQPVQTANRAVTPQAMRGLAAYGPADCGAHRDVGQRFAVGPGACITVRSRRPIRGQASPGETAELLDEGLPCCHCCCQTRLQNLCNKQARGAGLDYAAPKRAAKASSNAWPPHKVTESGPRVHQAATAAMAPVAGFRCYSSSPAEVAITLTAGRNPKGHRIPGAAQLTIFHAPRPAR